VLRESLAAAARAASASASTRPPTRSPSTSNCSTRANAKAFRYLPGQFGEISAFGEGESTFVIAGDPARPDG